MRRGFTVLEVLLAMVLGTALLACLWTALSMYLRAFDAGRTEVEQTQLVRALVRKIETDLRQTVPQPKKPPSAPQPSSTELLESLWSGTPTPAAPAQPTAGDIEGAFPLDVADSVSLVGTSHQLRLRVCQPAVLPREVLAVQDQGQERVWLPDSLRTVYYWLANPEGGDGAAGGSALSMQGSGLVRRQGAWLRWRDEMQQGMSQPVQAGDLTHAEDHTAFHLSQLPDEAQLQVVPDMIVAEEVAGLQFRYYDGAFWSEEWNSETLGRLPVAVEISIFLRSDDGEPYLGGYAGSADATDVLIPDYRVVVPLNIAERKPAAQQSSPQNGTVPNSIAPNEVWP